MEVVELGLLVMVFQVVLVVVLIIQNQVELETLQALLQVKVIEVEITQQQMVELEVEEQEQLELIMGQVMQELQEVLVHLHQLQEVQ